MVKSTKNLIVWTHNKKNWDIELEKYTSRGIKSRDGRYRYGEPYYEIFVDRGIRSITRRAKTKSEAIAFANNYMSKN